MKFCSHFNALFLDMEMKMNGRNIREKKYRRKENKMIFKLFRLIEKKKE